MSYTGNVTAVLGENLAQTLGKKGTSSDVTLFNHKQGDCILSFVTPSAYPDKPQSLVSALTMASQTILKIEALNSTTAETIVALDALNAEKGYLIQGVNVTQESIEPIIANSIASKYKKIENQPASIREMLAEYKPDTSGEAAVLVDHSFPVKGVGTVALGVVKQGVIRKHDEVTLNPQGGKTLVKSIQVHDTDVSEAQTGVRVGLALKDIKPEDIPRGTILTTNSNIKNASTVEVEIKLSKYSPRPIKPDDTYLAGFLLNYTPAKILEGALQPGQTGKIKIQLEKEIPQIPGRLTLLDPSQKMPRITAGGNI
jgi:selenocysteine-specific translation elongation factor